MVQWRQIEEYENYEVSDNGMVRNNKTRKMLYGCVNSCGYLQICLSNNEKKRRTFPMHRLVALAFIPNPENKQYVRHHDSDNMNNIVSNLYWQSYEEFMLWDIERCKERIKAKAEKAE